MQQHGWDAAADTDSNNFDHLVRNLIDDKYNREYKLDRKTRTKAHEILKDYYTKNLDEANVSFDILLSETRSFKYLNFFLRIYAFVSIRCLLSPVIRKVDYFFSDSHCGLLFYFAVLTN